MIKLRPHHLLCILTYIGKGYSENFTENFTEIIQRINKGATKIKIIKGPDDVCAPRIDDPCDECHCFNDDIQERDDLALKDLSALIRKPLRYDDLLSFTPDLIEQFRTAFAQNQIRKACKNCQWYALCSDVSKSGYPDTILNGSKHA